MENTLSKLAQVFRDCHIALDATNINPLKFFDILNNRPWHDARAIACACATTHTNQEKGGLGG